MERFYDAKPVKLDYDVWKAMSEEGARKPPIIIIHGVFVNKLSMRKPAEFLHELTDRKVYCLDLRGHGLSPYEKQLDVFSMAADVKKFMEDEGLDKVSFVCNSFASRVATVIAIDRPQVIEKLVFVEIAPYSCDVKRGDLALRYFEQLSLFFNKFGRKMNLEKSLDFVSNIYAAGQPGNFDVRDVLRSFLTEDQNGVRLNCDYDRIRDAILAGNLALLPLGVYDGEVLFCYGTASKPELRDECDESLKKYFPRHKFAVFEGASHMLMAEYPQRFAEQVANFLDE